MKLFSHPSHRPWKSLSSDSHIPPAATTTGAISPKTLTTQGWAKTKCRNGPDQLAKRTLRTIPYDLILWIDHVRQDPSRYSVPAPKLEARLEAFLARPVAPIGAKSQCYSIRARNL